MIRLSLPNKPTKLTATKEQALTQQYLSDGSAVWGKPWLKGPLFGMTHNKCAYCELLMRKKDARERTIDHYYPRKHHPNLVVFWGNLLPSCKSCNSGKQDYDPSDGNFVHPINDNPQDHLTVNGTFFCGITPQGEHFIKLLKINDNVDRVLAREHVYKEILKAIRECETYLRKAKLTGDSIYITNLWHCVDALLEASLPSSGFAAMIATTVLNHSVFKRAVQHLKKVDRWSEETKAMLKAAQDIELLKWD
jgi:hypothetical protein